ncbi:MAG: STAS domain-containing protein [Bdellovibrionales bacterium]|nr:STAS domain-containing protein [Bdellovibrionales bacterium]
MRAKITRNGDTAVIRMDGRLDVEVQEPLREKLHQLVRSHIASSDSPPKKYIFDLEHLEFVGSSGISTFVQTLRDFNSASVIRPRYANVKSEFQKIIKAFDEEEAFEFFDTLESARRSFDQ